MNKSFKIFICIFIVFIVSFGFSTTLFSQNNLEIKYFKDIDKTNYYIQFINEIPYFLVNRYNSYFEVLYNKENMKINEVIIYSNKRERERWIYQYPEPNIIAIDYKKINIVPSQIDMKLFDSIISKLTDEKKKIILENYLKDEKKEIYTLKKDNINIELISIISDMLFFVDYDYTKDRESYKTETIFSKDIFYFDMGRLIKKENYNSANRLNYYFHIVYDGSLIKQEYYFEANGSYVYKTFFYDEYKMIRLILREGSLKRENNEVLSINERWIYKNKQIYSIEKYEGDYLKYKYYFNEYRMIVKKEVYDSMIRVSNFFEYEYYNNLKLSKIREYELTDSFNLSSKKILAEHYFSEKGDVYINKIYENKAVIKELIFDDKSKITTIKEYYENGNLKVIDYNPFEITNISVFYNQLDPQNEIILLPIEM